MNKIGALTFGTWKYICTVRMQRLDLPSPAALHDMKCHTPRDVQTAPHSFAHLSIDLHAINTSSMISNINQPAIAASYSATWLVPTQFTPILRSNPIHAQSKCADWVPASSQSKARKRALASYKSSRSSYKHVIIVDNHS